MLYTRRSASRFNLLSILVPGPSIVCFIWSSTVLGPASVTIPQRVSIRVDRTQGGAEYLVAISYGRHMLQGLY